jgi:hypothetical protein
MDSNIHTKSVVRTGFEPVSFLPSQRYRAENPNTSTIPPPDYIFDVLPNFHPVGTIPIIFIFLFCSPFVIHCDPN